MGGIGSGTWHRSKKQTVEDALAIAIGDFRGKLGKDSAGALTWKWAGHQSSVAYSVDWADTPTISLHYGWLAHERIVIRIRLQSTRTQFGGKRWWFTCPVSVRGVPCGRRAGKLYLPPGARYFGCRLCHDLTYVSSQEAHNTQRLFTRMCREI